MYEYGISLMGYVQMATSLVTPGLSRPNQISESAGNAEIVGLSFGRPSKGFTDQMK
jgi:hypothetical protein